jgi:hypothetical protein
MFEQQPETLREKIQSLAAESVRQGNPSGWFETLYAQAEGDSARVPWAKNLTHPYLQDWLERYAPKGEHWSQVKLVSKLSKGVWEKIERKTGQNLAVSWEREQLLAFY